MEERADRLALQRSDDMVGAVGYRLLVRGDRIRRRLAGIVDAHVRTMRIVAREVRGEKSVADRLRHGRELRIERQQQRDVLGRRVAFALVRAGMARLHRADRSARPRLRARHRLTFRTQRLFDPRTQRIVGLQRFGARLQRVSIERGERIDDFLAVLVAVGALEIVIELGARARGAIAVARGDVGARTQLERAGAKLRRHVGRRRRQQRQRLRGVAVLERDLRIEQIQAHLDRRRAAGAA